MSEHDDDVRRLFAPLQAPTVPTDAEVRRVRRAAEAPVTTAPAPRRRRRLLAAGATLATVGLATVAIVGVVDRSTPGVFVGEAGARELLRSAADATRDDPVLTGWTLSTTSSVSRTRVEGRRCATCEVERGAYEMRVEEQTWTGARGEAYFRSNVGVPEYRVIENEGLLRSTNALDPPYSSPEQPGSAFHVLPATGARGELLADLASPWAIEDPAAVPATPRGIVDWTVRRLRALDRQAIRAGEEEPGRTPSVGRVRDRVGGALIALVTSPRLGGAQRAAAFEALAAQPGVVVAPLPGVFASSTRVGIRVASPKANAAGRPDGVSDPRSSPLVIFDRDTHRVVGAQLRDGVEPGTVMGTGNDGARVRALPGAAVVTEVDGPVQVTGPGLDADGERVARVDSFVDADRSGTVLEP